MNLNKPGKQNSQQYVKHIKLYSPAPGRRTDFPRRSVKHAKLYSDPFQADQREPLTAPDSGDGWEGGGVIIFCIIRTLPLGSLTSEVITFIY